ncbi:hypothetical protein H1C71_039953, partial [Ictidomys tridecemlineatus]
LSSAHSPQDFNSHRKICFPTDSTAQHTAQRTNNTSREKKPHLPLHCLQNSRALQKTGSWAGVFRRAQRPHRAKSTSFQNLTPQKPQNPGSPQEQRVLNGPTDHSQLP